LTNLAFLLLLNVIPLREVIRPPRRLIQEDKGQGIPVEESLARIRKLVGL
jgi:hypothetical protein